MEQTTLNLNEGSFPIEIKKTFKDLPRVKELGVIKDHINVKLAIEKFSKDLLLAKGIISATFEADCQTCFKKTLIKLNFKTNVGIKDNNYEIIDEPEPLEIHYQDLEKFILDDLISEEISLNFPSTVNCCSIESYKKLDIKTTNKIRPFQKIRDLIK